jgi:hypothetical protein
MSPPTNHPALGDGTFVAEAPLAVPGQAVSFAIGDFDRDTRLDLAVASSAGNVYVFFGLGRRQFQSPVVVPTGAIDNPSYADKLVVADFDKDGYTDLAVADNAGVSVFYSRRDRSFNPALNVFTGAATLASADFNHDQAADLALSSDGPPRWPVGNNVALLRGKGEGTFQDPLNYDSGSFVGLNSLVSGDFDRDGRLDFVTASGVNWSLERNLHVLRFSGCID